MRSEIRSLAVFILGFAASKDLRALNILRTEVSKDSSWQVQEILAKAFDQYCKDNGYEKSLPTIKDWLSDKNTNVCRAVTEGLRIWTSRPYFKDNPEVAIELISKHKNSDSEYLRKSVGNSLRDISKKQEEKMKNYDNFFFPSDNLEESKKFYSDVLGLSTKFDFTKQGMVAFKVGEEEPAIILKDKNKFPDAKPAIWIEVENVRKLYPELKDKGIKFVSKPFKIRTGWAVEFTDPSGNLLGITDYKKD